MNVGLLSCSLLLALAHIWTCSLLILILPYNANHCFVPPTPCSHSYAVSYALHSLASFCARDNVSLKGLARFYIDKSNREREDAIDMSRYQVGRRKDYDWAVPVYSLSGDSGTEAWKICFVRRTKQMRVVLRYRGLLSNETGAFMRLTLN
jgi:hypothetical protein